MLLCLMCLEMDEFSESKFTAYFEVWRLAGSRLWGGRMAIGILVWGSNIRSFELMFFGRNRSRNFVQVSETVNSKSK